MDPDAGVVWDYFKHLFPEFSVHHAFVYKFLWRIDPISGDEIAKQINLSKTTVYKALHDLVSSGLVTKTNFKPVGYYASNPVKDYSSNLKKVLAKLEKGVDHLEELLNNSSALSGEIYLIKKDGGQQKLFSKEKRSAIQNEQQLLEIKRVVEQQLKDTERKRLKEYAVYK
ncbi:MAG: helix-turn-helix domain-containing protein [archaeon]